LLLLRFFLCDFLGGLSDRLSSSRRVSQLSLMSCGDEHTYCMRDQKTNESSDDKPPRCTPTKRQQKKAEHSVKVHNVSPSQQPMGQANEKEHN